MTSYDDDKFIRSTQPEFVIIKARKKGIKGSERCLVAIVKKFETRLKDQKITENMNYYFQGPLRAAEFSRKKQVLDI